MGLLIFDLMEESLISCTTFIFVWSWNFFFFHVWSWDIIVDDHIILFLFDPSIWFLIHFLLFLYAFFCLVFIFCLRLSLSWFWVHHHAKDGVTLRIKRYGLSFMDENIYVCSESDQSWRLNSSLGNSNVKDLGYTLNLDMKWSHLHGLRAKLKGMLIIALG